MKLVMGLAAAASFWVLLGSNVTAHHDMVYAPCDPLETRPIVEQVYYINYQTGESLRYDDPFWSQKHGQFTNWRAHCLLGMNGAWQSIPILPSPHPPNYVVETRPTVNSTTTTTTTLIVEEDDCE